MPLKRGNPNFLFWIWICILNALVRAKREEKKLQFGRKNQRSQVRTEKPIRTGVPEVESEARHHYTNLTAFKTGDEL